MSIYLLPKLAQLSQKAVRRNGSEFFTAVQTKIGDQFESNIQAAKAKVVQEATDAANNARPPRAASAADEGSTAGEIFEKVVKREINWREDVSSEAYNIAKTNNRVGSAEVEAKAAGRVYDNPRAHQNSADAEDAARRKATADSRGATADDEANAAGHAFDNLGNYRCREDARDDAIGRAITAGRAGSLEHQINAAEAAYDKAILHRADVSLKPKSTEKPGGEYYKLSVASSTGKPVTAYLPQRQRQNPDEYWAVNWPLIERLTKAVKAPHDHIDSNYLTSGRKPQMTAKKLDRRDEAVTFFDTAANAQRLTDLSGQRIDVSLLPGDKLKVMHQSENSGILDSAKRKLGLNDATIKLANPKKMGDSLENGLFYAEARREDVRQFISPKTLLVGKQGMVTSANRTRYEAAQRALTDTANGGAAFSKAQTLADNERVFIKLLPGNKIRITDSDGNGKVGLLHRAKVRKVKINPKKQEESVNLSYQYAERVAKRNKLISPQFMVSPATNRVTQAGVTRYDEVETALDALAARLGVLETQGVKIKIQANGKVRISAPRTGRFAKLNPTPFTMELSRGSSETWANFINQKVMRQAEALANAR
ncbi:MAG: hypothetical protein K0Q50_1890 [Vampirovibrio sp.]|jgi:hypothetical protein|nr:hypothetical protein [Vampirovibrio sp.]